MSPIPLLSFENIKLVYRSRTGIEKLILDQVSGMIYPGETIGILGPSGSGKSQLVYSFARLNEFEGGKISADSLRFESLKNRLDILTLNEKDLASYRANHIAYIFQDPSSFYNPTLKVGEQLMFPFKSDIGKKTAYLELLSQCNIALPIKLFNAYPHQLSGGELQRMWIAQCLLRSPQLLIGDEITSALDDESSKGVLDLIKIFQQKLGFAFILVSHDQKALNDYCDIIWHMEDAKITSIEKKEILSFPKKHAPLGQGSPMILELKNLSKTYGSKGILRLRQKSSPLFSKINLSLHKAECIGIYGNSGIGKSTLAKIICGFESLDEGEIILNGKVIQNSKTSLGPNREILYLFQDSLSSLNPVMNAKQIIEETIKLYSPAQNINEIFESVQLPISVFPKRPNQLSGGQRQRLVLARAIAISPQIMVCDESLNALDAYLQWQLVDLLIKIKCERGIGILFISHQMQLLQAIADRIYKLEAGNLIAYTLGANYFSN